jgi:GH25 family lysozyme M1 (1,4-beta-N-acetylmuramidase)
MSRSLAVVASALFLATLVSAIASVAAPTHALASSKVVRAAACSGVNARTTAKATGSIKATLNSGTTITVVATVNGGSWKASCAGTTVSGTKWYRISAINGKSVKTRYGVSYLYAAVGLFKAVGAAPVGGSSKVVRVAACSGVNMRTTAKASGAIKATLNSGTTITVVATISGGSWSASCAGTAVSGTKWYRISAINGKSVKTRYGVSYLYAATGLFRAVGAAPVPPPPAPVGPLEGIDVSHWQGTINWPMVRAAGKRFAFVKASEATDFVDWNYTINRAQAKGAGLYVGAYHFAQPDRTPGDAVAEADHFLDTAQIGTGDLLPVLDLEVAGGLSQVELQEWVKGYLGRIYERTGVRGVIYMSPAFWANYAGDTTWFAANGYKVLWIAHWTTGEPWVPASGWGGEGWTFWQYTSSGTVPGITGRVDLDRYAGTDFSEVLIR